MNCKLQATIQAKKTYAIKAAVLYNNANDIAYEEMSGISQKFLRREDHWSRKFLNCKEMIKIWNLIWMKTSGGENLYQALYFGVDT